MMTRSTAVAVVFGALVGATAGLWSRQAPELRRQGPPPLPAPGALARGPETSVRAREPRAPSSAEPRTSRSGAPARAESVAAAPALLPEPTALPIGTDASERQTLSTVPFPHWAPLEAAPTGKAELTRVLVRCGERDGRACLASAVAYTEGFGTAKNKTEAKRFERMALTLLGRHCEQRDAFACVDLAAMYQRGIVVAKDDGHAALLLDRARDLCKIHRADGCANVSK